MGEVDSGPVTPAGVRRVYRVLCNLAACDGEVAPIERRLLDRFADGFDLPAAEAAALEAEGRAATGVVLGSGRAERDLLLQLVVDLVAADGRIGPDERARALRLAAAAQLPADQLEARLSAQAREVRARAQGGGGQA